MANYNLSRGTKKVVSMNKLVLHENQGKGRPLGKVIAEKLTDWAKQEKSSGNQ